MLDRLHPKVLLAKDWMALAESKVEIHGHIQTSINETVDLVSIILLP
jgi:hypothetical protein